MNAETRAQQDVSPTAADADPEALNFIASDVTGTQTLEVTDVDPTVTAGHMAQVLASMMNLPPNVGYQLREDTSSSFLEEQEQIGEQVSPGSHLTVTAKTHLGGR